LFIEKRPTILVDLPSKKIVKVDDQLELRLVTDGLGTYHCKWLFNEQEIKLNNSGVILTIEDHDKICCLRIEHFQAQHAGEYQFVLANGNGIVVKSKIMVCRIGKAPKFIDNESESQIIGTRGEDCIIRCRVDATPESIITWYVNSYFFLINICYRI
jgi:hypothetical protein